MRRVNRSAVVLMVMFAGAAQAQIDDLRITEVDPIGNTAEVKNIGDATISLLSTDVHPFCKLINYSSRITGLNTPGMMFAPGQIHTYLIGLNDTSSDLWLYDVGLFTTRSDQIHGLQYGAGFRGRTGIADDFGFSPADAPEGNGGAFQLWPSAAAFSPTPASGESLAWDGFGFDPRDWYIDATPTIGSEDSTTPGIVASGLTGDGSTEDFESVSLGDEVIALGGWTVVSDPLSEGRFTARVIDDVGGTRGPRGGSTSDQWLRVRDQDGRDLQNRFYSNALTLSETAGGYSWHFFLLLEQAAPIGAASQPRLVIQHAQAQGGFANAWGVELSGTDFNLVTTSIGGPEQSIALANPGAFPLNQWLEFVLEVDLTGQTVSLSVLGGATVELDIAPSMELDPNSLRLCYRGEGEGNVSSVLLDDVSFTEIDPEPCPGDANGDGVVDFADITDVLGNWLNDYTPGTGPGDADGSGVVNFSDITSILGNWLAPCP